MRNKWKRQAVAWCLGGMAMVMGAAWAADSNPDAGKPISIEADRAHLDDANKLAIYEGHVVMTQGSLRLTAVRVEARQDAEGFTHVLATGDLAYFTRREASGAWAEGWAKKVDYNGRAEQIILTDQAHLRRGEDDVRGNVVTYNMKNQIFQAAGSGTLTGRVKAVIHPKTEAGATP